MCKPACLQNCAGVLQIFALFLVHAYSTRVWKRQAIDSTSLSATAVEHGFQSPEGHSKLIMDGPWILLWPCLLLWPIFEGVVGFGFIHNAVGEWGHSTGYNISGSAVLAFVFQLLDLPLPW